MTARTFSITLDEGDRLAVLTALGFAQMITPQAMRRPVTELIQRLSVAPGQDSPASGTEAARAVLAPPIVDPTVPRPKDTPAAPTDYFQRNKKGDVLMTAPDGAELSTVPIKSAKQQRAADKYLTVIFGAGVTADGEVRPAGKASCWDQDLRRMLTNREGKTAAVWIQESGNYLNIVGVRA